MQKNSNNHFWKISLFVLMVFAIFCQPVFLFMYLVSTDFLFFKFYNHNMKIYLDVIFIENVFINYIIFLTTSCILKKNTNYLRILISSVLGGFYVIGFITNFIPLLSNFFIKILLSIMMVYFAFTPSNFKKLFKDLNVFYLVTFVVGGIASSLVYTIDDKCSIIKNNYLVGFNSFKISIFASIIGFVILCFSFFYKNELLKQRNLICRIRISNNYKSIETTCFIDSGNTLKDPFTHKSVIIVEKNIIEKITDLNNFKKFRLIPFTSIGNDNGILLGISMESVSIIITGQKDITIKNAVIGIYNKTFNKNYHALIGIDLLQGAYSYEYNAIDKTNI